ncbi:MAG: excinuclease ABC subunit UvrC [Candidatus Omnitrophota bacterium]
MDIREKVKQLPNTPGVYLMKDAGGEVIYVGKAVDLRKRVQSYFRKRKTRSKTDFLVENIADIRVIQAQSEAEALILEASLIKKYTPKYNIDLRDDKTYPYIEITGERYPRICVVRPKWGRSPIFQKNEKNRAPSPIYYGPYTNPRLIREALGIMRRVFPFRTCDPYPDKVCLDYHIGLCEGPCEGFQTRRDYLSNIRNVRLILEGKKDTLYRKLTRRMEKLSREQRFEEAAKARDQLRALGALYSGTKDINYFKEAEQLKRALDLPRVPERIETFDISNIMGQQSVGSMVAFFNGKPDKNNYRRFRIKTVKGIDDFQMMAEVVRRRYSRLKREGRAYPDLIVVDGGKGQLSAAFGQLDQLDIDIPMIGLAKREEEVYLPARRAPVVLPRNSLGLQLLQRCRDEAHRFAVAYHRKLRDKKTYE